MTQLLITTGPESCGKTTLATALSSTLQAPLVPEAARSFLDQRFAQTGHYHYQQADLSDIAQQQYQLEQQALAPAPSLLVCDTDLLVVMIWSEVKFGSVDPAIRDLFITSLATTNRHYLLCDYHLPWQADPQREDPDNRAALFTRYQQALEHYRLSYQVMTGSVEARVALVQSHLLPPTACPCCSD
jgi:nicotinamide riboside kinase